jgi:hypothetical protein
MSTEHDGKGLYTALPFDRQRYGKDDQIMAVLYTDTINGEQTCRDDLWLATSSGLRDVYAKGRKDEAEESEKLRRALGDIISQTIVTERMGYSDPQDWQEKSARIRQIARDAL